MQIVLMIGFLEPQGCCVIPVVQVPKTNTKISWSEARLHFVRLFNVVPENHHSVKNIHKHRM
jgi:hypothetical protein